MITLCRENDEPAEPHGARIRGRGQPRATSAASSWANALLADCGTRVLQNGVLKPLLPPATVLRTDGGRSAPLARLRSVFIAEPFLVPNRRHRPGGLRCCVLRRLSRGGALHFRIRLSFALSACSLRYCYPVPVPKPADQQSATMQENTAMALRYPLWPLMDGRSRSLYLPFLRWA